MTSSMLFVCIPTSTFALFLSHCDSSNAPIRLGTHVRGDNTPVTDGTFRKQREAQGRASCGPVGWLPEEDSAAVRRETILLAGRCSVFIV